MPVRSQPREGEAVDEEVPKETIKAGKKPAGWRRREWHLPDLRERDQG